MVSGRSGIERWGDERDRLRRTYLARMKMMGAAVTSNETMAIIASVERAILYDHLRRLGENLDSGFCLRIITADNADLSVQIYLMIEILATPMLTIALIDRTHQANRK